MYGTIYVPADNSDHSNAATGLASALGKAFGAKVVGSHVYAAKLHDVRFKQMEFTLPDEYKEEEELERQRKIHDALIARGLHLISDSYLDQLDAQCTALSVPFERKHFDGRNFEAIVSDILASDYDLVVIGALGMGAVKGSQAGSVCERVLRRTDVDTLVVRNPETRDGSEPGPVVVCLDGSPHSYGGLRAGLGLAKAFGKQLQVVAAHDASEPADTRALLTAHVDVARQVARRSGVSIAATLLEGDPHEEVLDYLSAAAPWLAVAGRQGLDAAGAEIGSLAEGLVRRAPCNVLLTSETLRPADALAGATAA